ILQLVGINLSAAILFRFYGGLSSKGARYDRGKKWVFPVTLGITTLVLIGLLNWQFFNTPNLERSSRAQRATADIQQVVRDNPLVKLVEANIRFTRSNIEDQNTLLCILYVQRGSEVTLSKEKISESLTSDIQNYIKKVGYDVTPLVEVTVFDPPEL
ncbi:MAG: TIGR00341 family protein, partial [Limnoraphis sp.]